MGIFIYKNNKKNYKILLFLFLFFIIFFQKTYALTYLFSHGFADRAKQCRKYVKEYETRRGKVKKNDFYIIDGCVKAFNYLDAARKPFVNIFKTCLGQEKDLCALRKAYREIEDDEIILVGVSRGASAAAIFMGTDKPKRVKAVVLISPFDHLINIFKPTRFSRFLYRLLKKCSCFSENGKHPIHWLCKKQKNIPIIFVCSKADKTVPCRSTINLYKSLLVSGHTNIYLLCLPEGRHAKLLKSKCAAAFQNVIHAFYEKYALPNNQKFAEKGKSKLQKCAPSTQRGEESQGARSNSERRESAADTFDKAVSSFITILAYCKSCSIEQLDIMQSSLQQPH